MDQIDHVIEERLREALSRLADKAPAGPSAVNIARRLRRRTMFRRTFVAGAAAAILVGMAVVLNPCPSPNGAAPEQLAQLSTSAQLPKPIAANAGQQEIESLLRQYFSSVNSNGNVLVTKSPEEGLSFCFSGRVLDGKLKENLARMLESFHTATITLANGQLSYSLVVGKSS